VERESLVERTGFAGTITDYAEVMIDQVRRQVGDKKVVCALSGGVDSSVCAAIVHRAVGDQLTCIFVDHGLMRAGEPELVNELFGRHFGMQLVSVDAADRFFAKLADVSDPETKRKIIGEQFIRVFEEEARKLGRVDYLAQGTIYPDILESAEGAVKAHHNVGGLPEEFDFELVEPVKYLFKDEVRVVGEALGLPHELVWRQPFPGPGLAVRVIGALDRDKVRIVREADAIFREEIARAGLDGEIWQYYAALPGVRSTGVQDGRRTYGHAVVLRAVLSRDALSADVAELPYDLLRRVTLRITSEVEGVNRVMYDTTPKPPGTIEWE
jgi:GMP synthase (glutamine-hydrolysing)